MKGLTTNSLKIIAILAMLIDHIGYYFSFCLPTEVYYICRIIGRIAMPIFVFCLVQGFIHTKDLKRYILRIFALACVTQVVMSIMYYFNNTRFNLPIISEYSFFNILFSFTLTLVLLGAINQIEQMIKSRKIDVINLFISIILIVIISCIYIRFNFDYGFVVPVLAIGLYFLEILRKRQALIIKLCYMLLLFAIIVIPSVINSRFEYGVFSFLAMLAILLYNGERGSGNSKVYYLFFPIHHALLFLIAVLIKISIY